MKKWIIAGLAAALLLNALPLAAQPDTPAAGEHLVVQVAPEMVECMGMGPMQCLQIRYAADDEWLLWYSPILDFNFVAGFNYTLLVSVVPNVPTPADAPSFFYTLESILAATPAPVEGDMLFPPTHQPSGDFLLAEVGPETEVCQDGFIAPLDCLQVTINGEQQLINPARIVNFSYQPGAGYTLLLERWDLVAQNVADIPAVVYQLWQVVDKTEPAS